MKIPSARTILLPFLFTMLNSSIAQTGIVKADGNRMGKEVVDRVVNELMKKGDVTGLCLVV